MKQEFPDIDAYNAGQIDTVRSLCDLLRKEINKALPEAESKMWHGHPVWFLEGNPIVGYHKLKGPLRVLFWSGQSFTVPGLEVEGTFKAAEKRYEKGEDLDVELLRRWLAESRDIQWDYKNIVKRKGELLRLK